MLLERLGLAADAFDFDDAARWGESKARLAAIGESDRMTLLFRKRP